MVEKSQPRRAPNVYARNFTISTDALCFLVQISNHISNNPHIKIVHSLDELISTPFKGTINALCWQRQLQGNFREIVEQLKLTEGRMSLDEALLDSLKLSEAGYSAKTQVLADKLALEELGFQPNLECLYSYTCDLTSGPIATDVYSFHVDKAAIETDTYLCTYSGLSSEILQNDEATRKVDIPEIREQLLQAYGGKDGARFKTHLSKRCYDLHYAAHPQANILSMGVGNLWRIAVEYPQSPVAPCIHRAPALQKGTSARLLLIC